MDFRDSVLFTAEYIIVIQILKDQRLCDNSSNNVVILMDNRGRGDFVQVCNINVKHDINVGETIFSLFLGTPNSHITSIMKLKPQTEKNSTCVQALHTAAAFKDHCLTR